MKTAREERQRIAAVCNYFIFYSFRYLIVSLCLV